MEEKSYSKLIIILGKKLDRPRDPIYEKQFLQFLAEEKFLVVNSIQLPKVEVYQNLDYTNHDIQSHYLIGNEGYVHELAFFIEQPKF